MLMVPEHADGVETYWTHISNAASSQACDRGDTEDPCLSVETSPDQTSALDFKTFARECPDRLFPLLASLRVDFQERFIEYYVLGKSQNFLAAVYGQVQTRVWQALRVIEQALGARIVLGAHPGVDILFPILHAAGLEDTQYGSLAFMITKYADTQNYAAVAKAVGAPVPAIRKIFRPTIATLLASKDVNAAAVGAYLRSLTHQTSRTGEGLDKRHLARARRIRTRRFTAPPAQNAKNAPPENSSVLSFGTVSALRNTPWMMFELQDTDFLPVSSKQSIDRIRPILATLTVPETKYEHIFDDKPAQIFIPTTAEGNLKFGYIFARCLGWDAKDNRSIRLTAVRGISELSAVYDSTGEFVRAVTMPNLEVQRLIAAQPITSRLRLCIGDFVEILTGAAAHYCGTITKKGDNITVEVNFPSGRRFIVTADPTALRVIPNGPAEQRKFWGVTLYPKIYPSAEQTESPASQESAE
jgi:hypothetical protein